MAYKVDHDLLQEMFKHAAGRGVTSVPHTPVFGKGITGVPSTGAGLKGRRTQYHIMLPLHSAEKAKKFSTDIMDELNKKVIEI